MDYDSLGGQSQILTQAEAEAQLRPYLERLNKCIQGGWDAWKSDYQAKHPILSPRARAAIVYDEIVHRAMTEFPATDHVKPVRTANSFWLYVGDMLTIRFKKIRKNGRCSNVRTQLQMCFLAQAQVEAQMQLPGMPVGTLVHAGYTLDPLQQNVASKAIVCQHLYRVLWRIDLTDTLAQAVEMQPMTTAPVLPQPAVRFVAKDGTGKNTRKKAIGVGT